MCIFFRSNHFFFADRSIFCGVAGVSLINDATWRHGASVLPSLTKRYVGILVGTRELQARE